MIIEASRQATIKSEARSPKAESRSVSGFGMVLSQRPSPPTQGSSARRAMFIATTTPDAQPSSVGAAWMGQGGSKVRPVEGRSCSAALKSEDRRPKPERKPKSEFREWPDSIGGGSAGVAIRNPKPEARRPKEARKPKPEGRTSDLGFRPSFALDFGLWTLDFGLLSFGLRSATNMSPLRGLANRVVRLAINMPPLRGLAGRVVRLAINMPPLRGLAGRAVRLAINMSPLRGLANRVVRLAINMSPLRGLAGRVVRLAINMPPLRGLADRAGCLATNMSPLRGSTRCDRQSPC